MPQSLSRILDAADALRAKRREAHAQLDALLQTTFLTLFASLQHRAFRGEL